MSSSISEVQYDPDLGAHKIVIPLMRADNNSINVTIPIFIDRNIPESNVLYDYYNSGAFYVNLPSEVNLVSTKDTLHVILDRYIYGGDNFVNINFEDETAIAVFNSKYNWTSIYFHPTKVDTFGFLFSLDLIFETKKTNNQIPICKNLTISETGREKFEIVSDKYPYANLIKDTFICCHETLSSSSFTTCPFALSNQKKCSFYESSEQIIKYARSYSSMTSEIETHISLVYFNSYTHHIFVIKNELTQNEITRLSFPVDGNYSYLDLHSEAVKIFDEVTSSYSEIVTYIPEESSSKSLDSVSYISHLIEEKSQVG